MPESCYLKQIDINNLRLLQKVSLQCVNGLNLIAGANASGKTSLLEAIYLLSTGKSFRHAKMQHCITHHKEAFVLAAQIRNSLGFAVQIGMQKDRFGQTRVRIAGKTARAQVELARLLPVQVFHPESHTLISGTPANRRAFLDWGAFYADSTFHATWQRFHRALQQRNEILRQKRSEQELEIWDAEFIHAATLLSQARQDYLANLQPVLEEVLQHLPLVGEIHCAYMQGWKNDQALHDVLLRHRAREKELGHTTSGPQRADLKLATPAHMTFAEQASRGQQKSLVIALMLAQIMLYQKQTQQNVILLLDDLASELDKHSLETTLTLLKTLENQVFITTLDQNRIKLENWKEYKLFHVKDGYIT